MLSLSIMSPSRRRRLGGKAGKPNGYGELARNVSLTKPWGKLPLARWKTQSWAGIVRIAAAIRRRGRQDAALSLQKMQTWMFAFFASLQPPTTGRGLFLPLWAVKRTGLRPESDHLWFTGMVYSGDWCSALQLIWWNGDNASGQVERANPSYFISRGGSPAARGRDNGCRLLIAAWVRWAWWKTRCGVGLVRLAAHGALIAGRF